MHVFTFYMHAFILAFPSNVDVSSGNCPFNRGHLCLQCQGQGNWAFECQKQWSCKPKKTS